MVYLVDTSVWILSFSPACPTHLKFLLDEALKEDRVVTCGVVIAELLQGSRSPKERRKLREEFGALPYFPWGEEDWLSLGETSAELRSHGCAIPVTDLIVALLAVRHRATLLHRDRHFDLAAKHLSLSAEGV